MKIVIYKSEGIYYTTSEENYNARIQDARKILKMEDFDNPLEIISYFCEYFGSKAEDFIIIDR